MLKRAVKEKYTACWPIGSVNEWKKKTSVPPPDKKRILAIKSRTETAIAEEYKLDKEQILNEFLISAQDFKNDIINPENCNVSSTKNQEKKFHKWEKKNNRQTYLNIFLIKISKFLSSTHGLNNMHQIYMSKMFILWSTETRSFVTLRHSSRFVCYDDLHRLRGGSMYVDQHKEREREREYATSYLHK